MGAEIDDADQLERGVVREREIGGEPDGLKGVRRAVDADPDPLERARLRRREAARCKRDRAR